jgi:type I restriction enzyme S subunit
MFAARPGDVVFSKIDARNGAIGVLPPTIPDAVVTPEFPIFTPKRTAISARYLELVLRAGGFIEALRRRATGTSGRKRITPESFRSLSIPLPPLVEQQALVAAHDLALAEAHALELQATEAEQAGARAFCDALGVAAPPPLPDRPMFVARFRDLERWSHEAVLRRATGGGALSAKWPEVRVSEIGRVSYGMQKHPGNRPGESARPYLRVANVQRNRLDLGEIKLINVPDAELERYRLVEGDLLLCEGNSPDLVGRGAVWHSEVPDCVHQNHVLKIRLQQDRAIPEFVLSVINSEFGQAYFRSKSKRTTNLASINSKEVAGFTFPLPPLEIQRELVKALAASRAKAAKMREDASEKRVHAGSSFEGAIYGNEEADGEDKQ